MRINIILSPWDAWVYEQTTAYADLLLRLLTTKTHVIWVSLYISRLSRQSSVDYSHPLTSDHASVPVYRVRAVIVEIPGKEFALSIKITPF